MKLVKTYGRSAKTAAALIKSIEQRGAVSSAKAEPTVRLILADVRKSGDRALRKYATKFDSLAKNAPLLVSREEMAKAEDLGRYFRIPADNRDLNYNKYFVEGEPRIAAFEDYTSHSTERLDIEGTKALLRTLDCVVQ